MGGSSDGPHNTSDPWSSSNNLPTSNYSYSTGMMGSGSHLPQTTPAYPNMHLPHDPMVILNLSIYQCFH
ncbi:hypothetical protein CHUAL_000785 [Chamberlinius hualienensis]